MDAVFPLVGSSLAEALGIDDCEDFMAIVKEMGARLVKEDKEDAYAKEEAKKQADEAYTSNPLFGRF
jgi:hypothetical protein